MNIRYFHLRVGQSMHGGATVKVTQEDGDNVHVLVQHTRCSGNDTYQRKVGREQASKAPVEQITLAELPVFLAERHRKACKEAGKSSLASPVRNFAFAVLAFLPR